MNVDPEPKQLLFDEFARIGRVVASSSRLVLLDLLSQGEKSVDTLAEQAGLTVSNASNHLRELRAVSLVDTRRDAQRIYYRLASPSVGKLLRSLQDVAQEHLAEVREIVRDYYEHPDTLDAVDAETLHTRLQTQSVVLLDVRPLDEFSAGHIPGAVSVPIEELDRRLEQLPRDREIVAYCRGPYCLFSKQAVQRLRGHGFRAFQMRDGVAEWEELGYPVAAAADLPRTLNARQDKEEGETE